MGTATFADASGETASYTFTGTQVRVYLWQYDTSQGLGVYIDNVLQTTINWGTGSETSVMAYESGTLTAGSHTIRVEYTSGEPHLDAFEYYN